MLIFLLLQVIITFVSVHTIDTDEPSSKTWSDGIRIRNDETVIVDNITTYFPEKRSSYWIYNTGSCATLQGSVYYKSPISEWKFIRAVHIEPLAINVIAFDEERYWKTQLRIKNNGNHTNGVYIAYGENSRKPLTVPSQMREIQHLRPTLRSGGQCNDYKIHTRNMECGIYDNKNITEFLINKLGEGPNPNEFLKQLVSTFQLKNGADWNPSSEHLETEEIRTAVYDEHSEQLMMVKIDIESISKDLLSKSRSAINYFMFDVYSKKYDMRQFSYSSNSDHDKRMNYILLPIFMEVARLRVTVYLMGLHFQAPHELSHDQKMEMRSLVEDTVENATKHVNAVYTERLANAYASDDLENVFNEVQAVKSYMGVYGFENLNIMNYLIAKFMPNDKSSRNSTEGRNISDAILYNDVVTYSPYFGRFTPDMGINAHCLRQPLTPKLLPTMKRNRLYHVNVYVIRVYNAPRIGGLRMSFENGDTYTHGQTSQEGGHIILGETTRIDKIRATGCGAVDSLEFSLSNGTVVKFGEESWSQPISYDFAKHAHHIIGIALTSSKPALGLQAANIAVAYYPNYGHGASTTERHDQSKFSENECECNSTPVRNESAAKIG